MNDPLVWSSNENQRFDPERSADTIQRLRQTMKAVVRQTHGMLRRKKR